MSMKRELSRLAKRVSGRSDAKTTTEQGFPKVEGKSYVEVISEINQHRNAAWYLEIGSRTGSSLAHMSCNFIAVDPEFKIENPVMASAQMMHFFQTSSDDFFASNFLSRNEITPDVAFVDGLHFFEYALRDFMNCEAAMRKDGVIAIHDVCPFGYDMATRDISRTERSLPWTGDVWKLILVLLDLRPDLELHMLNCRKTGLALITSLDKNNRTLWDRYDEILETYAEMDFATLTAEAYYNRFVLEDAEEFLEGFKRTGS